MTLTNFQSGLPTLRYCYLPRSQEEGWRVRILRPNISSISSPNHTPTSEGNLMRVGVCEERCLKPQITSI